MGPKQLYLWHKYSLDLGNIDSLIIILGKGNLCKKHISSFPKQAKLRPNLHGFSQNKCNTVFGHTKYKLPIRISLKGLQRDHKQQCAFFCFQSEVGLCWIWDSISAGSFGVPAYGLYDLHIQDFTGVKEFCLASREKCAIVKSVF